MGGARNAAFGANRQGYFRSHDSDPRDITARGRACGTRILHSIGTWAAVLDDETVVEDSTHGDELVLLAKVRPAAQARIAERANPGDL